MLLNLLKKPKVVLVSLVALVIIVAATAGVVKSESKQQSESSPESVKCQGNTVTVTESQAKSLKIEAVERKEFADEREAVGYIDFNQERTVPVFSPWPGRITQVLVKAGDDIKKGDTLFTIDSPDLVQAESNLISTAGVLGLASKALERGKQLIEIKGISQKDLDQAVSDQQTAEANYKAARDAVRIFGKSDAEMNTIVADRKTNGQLAISSPIAGRVTSRNAALGMLVQPGSAPAPITVADISSMWMIANVPEYLLPSMQKGAKIVVSLAAYPGRAFEGKITNISSAIDSNTHTIAVRSEMADPGHEFLPQMLASFVIRTGTPMTSLAIPERGIVRETNGTITVFVTKDGLSFERRVVKTGMAKNGLQQILEGISPDEKVATDGSLFLSNALALTIR